MLHEWESKPPPPQPATQRPPHNYGNKATRAYNRGDESSRGTVWMHTNGFIGCFAESHIIDSDMERQAEVQYVIVVDLDPVTLMESKTFMHEHKPITQLCLP
ncbi:uncharacterized protein PHALS_13609 [Plasmopara halstedii]|uniref:Uncharacterized protein n=1 Tax=Plasmopara halstedii TaxID=4781 RepID=A0A0P1AQB7_PLAHL|nr:uncharacterized protein PHALS_13609 [Plasmopara halstedii]CEG43412.1 hypothetical protein PHALS_13609 [Plasmopara halstedii]|eukprot:XP_024579781.1 hypothetical protein PHALS_13609 [Plasmopara halstedii]